MQSISHWLNSYVQRIDKPLWRLVPLMRLTAQPLCWIDLLENAQCDSMLSVGVKKTQVQDIYKQMDTWKIQQKIHGIVPLLIRYSCSPRLQRFSLPQLPTGWRLIDQLNLWIRCDAIPSVPNRIRMERYLEIASDRQLGPLHFSSSILLRTGGGCFTKIETVLVKVRRAPESIMWYSWGRPLFEAKKRQLDSMASGFEGGHPPPSEPRNFIFIQVWRNQSFGWLESCQIHSWKGIPKIWVTSQVRCLQSAKWMEHHKKT